MTLIKSSLGDVKSSLSDAESSLGDSNTSLGDAKKLLGDVYTGQRRHGALPHHRVRARVRASGALHARGVVSTPVDSDTEIAKCNVRFGMGRQKMVLERWTNP